MTRTSELHPTDVGAAGRSPGERILDDMKNALADLSPIEYAKALAELDGEIAVLIRENDDRPNGRLELWDSREDDEGWYTRPGGTIDGYSER